MWEYNMFMAGNDLKRKNDIANSIMTGYYTAYYTNGGKSAKDPNTLISALYATKQSFEDGLTAIEKVKKIEQGGK